MKFLRQVLSLALCAPAFALVSQAQQAVSEVAQIERAAAAYAASHFVSGDVAFDPAPNKEEGPVIPRSAEEGKQLALALRATHVGNRERFYSCAKELPSTCRVTGADVVVSMNRPDIKGDEAFVIVRTYQPTTVPKRPVVRIETRLRLEKRAGVWVVTGPVGGGSTT
jgi:hypothetical protein